MGKRKIFKRNDHIICPKCGKKLGHFFDCGISHGYIEHITCYECSAELEITGNIIDIEYTIDCSQGDNQEMEPSSES